MNQHIAKRNEQVELLRILACFMVIVIHIRPFAFSGSTLRSSAVLIYALSGPAVAIFFLISGFFLRGSQSVLHVWRRFLTAVVLPTMLFLLMLSFLRTWIGQPSASILQSIRAAHPLKDLRGILQGFLCLDVVPFGSYAEHLWYVLSYAGIMLWAPVILGLLRGKQERILKLLLLYALLHYTLENVNVLRPLPLLPYLPECVGKPTMYAIAGLLLYRTLMLQDPPLSPEKKRLYRRSFFCICLLTTVLLFLLQRRLYQNGLQQGQDVNALNLSYYYTSWNGMLCGLQALSICGFCLLLPAFPEKPAAWIRRLGSCTFPTYLIHFLIVNHFRALGTEAIAQDFFGGSAVGLLLYTLCYAAFIFLLCIVLVLCWRTLKHGILTRMGRHRS